jgi:cellulose synthase/poly-beta-1,6-N-acetylglucosamine synthase-like glycosyltransferase
MMALILFWVSIAALMHTYVLYPALLNILARRRALNRDTYSSVDELPGVTVLMAVHNEQEVLLDKIRSIFSNKIPAGRLRVIVGSDASSDNTNVLLKETAMTNEYLRYIVFEKRMGKSAIINELVKIAGTGIIIITDANVIFEDDTLFHLLKHFKNSDIGLVDSNMRHRGLKNSGISLQENAYISREVKIKYNEGILWGTMMGPFGGCYALRKELYRNVPSQFLVDDFFINMEIFASKHMAILEPEAIVYEDVSNSLREEFRRKIRIAVGNFQNLKYFSATLFSNTPGLSFSYISHKVLRWLGPFFLATIFATSFYLRNENNFYFYVFVIQIFILVLPLIDYLLGKIKIHVIILRFITHFLSMNFALLVGFIKFLKGVKTNVWEPTKRNQ